jgi:hypothetical protein
MLSTLFVSHTPGAQSGRYVRGHGRGARANRTEASWDSADPGGALPPLALGVLHMVKRTHTTPSRPSQKSPVVLARCVCSVRPKGASTERVIFFLSHLAPTSSTCSPLLCTHQLTLDAPDTPLNRPPNATQHHGESARPLSPAPRTSCLFLAVMCVFLLSMHVCVLAFARLRSPLHGHGYFPPLQASPAGVAVLG